MANTTSLSFPNMFNVSQKSVAVIEDGPSVVNRTRLLMLSEPSSLYNNPTFGVGLRQHLFKYNTENERAIIQDKIIEQLRLNEPCVIPDECAVVDGLIFNGGDNTIIQEYNKLKLTTVLVTTFGDRLEVGLDGKH